MFVPELKTWNDVAGLDTVKKDLQEICDLHAKFRSCHMITKLFQNKPDAVLLYGPPGCGKSCLAQALCSHLQYTFMQVYARDLLNPSTREQTIRDIFDKVSCRY